MKELEKKLTAMLVVAVALVRADGMVLMQRRRYESMHGGLWEFPGGKVEAGETPEYAAVREIEEELGVVLESDALVAVGFASGRMGGHDSADRPLVILLYTAADWTGEPLCHDAAEIGWFAPSAIGKLQMPPLDYALAVALEASIDRRSSARTG